MITKQYDETFDAMEISFENCEESYGESIDGFITVFRDMTTDKVVGIRIDGYNTKSSKK